MMNVVQGAQGSALHVSLQAAQQEQQPTTPQHTVQRGETLHAIAQQHGVSAAAMMNANPAIANPNVIYPDQTLTIPAQAGPVQGGSAEPNVQTVQMSLQIPRVILTSSALLATNGASSGVTTASPAQQTIATQQTTASSVAQQHAPALPSKQQLLAALAKLGIKGKLAENPEKLARHEQVQARLQELDSMGITGKAARKLANNDSKFAEFQEALKNPGDHRIKVGKYRIRFSVDEQGSVDNVSVKKKRSGLSKLANKVKESVKKIGERIENSVTERFKKFINSKFGQILLTVLSYCPIPIVAACAKIVMALNSAYQGVKNGNPWQVVAGVAGAVGAGAKAFAGAATSGAAAGIANAADKVADFADKVNTATEAYKNRDLGGFLSAGASMVSSFADGLGAGARQVAESANNVKEWSDTYLIGREALENARNGDWLGAMSGAATVANRAGAQTGIDAVSQFGQQLDAAHEQLALLHDTVAQGRQVVQGLRDGDVKGAVQGFAQWSQNAAATSGSAGMQRLADDAAALAQQTQQLDSWARQGQQVVDALRDGRWQTAVNGLEQLGMPLRDLAEFVPYTDQLEEAVDAARELRDQAQRQLAPLLQAFDQAQAVAELSRSGNLEAAQASARQLAAGLQMAGYPTQLLEHLLKGTESVVDTVAQLEEQAKRWEEQLKAKGQEAVDGMQNRVREQFA